jgi:hypothetical protein
VLEGGARAVADWAEEHGFQLTPDAPEVLEFYARRSPVFLAARFDAAAARARGQGIGDGTPVHLTIPTAAPWVPIRILALGRAPREPVEADVYLLTEGRPGLLAGPGLRQEVSRSAGAALLDDLRADKGMEWLPGDMWLSHLSVDGPAAQLDHDLAIAPGGGQPSRFDFDRGLGRAQPAGEPSRGSSNGWAPLVGVGAGVAVLGALARWAS